MTFNALATEPPCAAAHSCVQPCAVAPLSSSTRSARRRGRLRRTAVRPSIRSSLDLKLELAFGRACENQTEFYSVATCAALDPNAAEFVPKVDNLLSPLLMDDGVRLVCPPASWHPPETPAHCAPASRCEPCASDFLPHVVLVGDVAIEQPTRSHLHDVAATSSFAKAPLLTDSVADDPLEGKLIQFQAEAPYGGTESC
ncbi:unnamed protein product [Polarella glacialis]|uniref:Uncharacterized protein n=1 Tax=Polarella glacialis TaxID=89957 RepID=A0A813F686_POLGL|nr:unnamed protein product [Polarella glacialis]